MNRRVFELIIVSGLLLRPVFGSARLWSVKTMAATEPGSLLHTTAEVVSILT
jgi:hypothetical protein